MNIDIEPIIDDPGEHLPENEAIEANSVQTESFPEDMQSQTNRDLTDEPEAVPVAGHPIISLRHVDIYQKDILVLSDVNLTVEKGELVYLVGKTGCGKSSLLKLLYGEVAPHCGDVEVAGFDMNHVRADQVQMLRRKLGIVFQDFQLLYDRSVYENLKFVTKVTGWKDKHKRDDRIMEVLERVGLKTKGHKMPHQLSGGEQQRVCIARALVNYPEIILADEPTGNLDPETSYDIFHLFREISGQGTPVLIATHDYLIVDKIPARVLFIEQGKVI